MSDAQVRSIIDRILRLKEEQRGIGDDIREVYAEAKSNGYDKTALGKVVTYIEKRQEDSAALEEHEAIVDLYLCAYDGKSGTGNAPTRTHAHAPDPVTVRSSGAAATVAEPEGSQLAPAGDVSEESPAKNSPNGANESQHPGLHATDQLRETSTGPGHLSGMVREARTEAAAVTDRRDGQLHSNHAHLPNTAGVKTDEGAPPPGDSSVAISEPDAGTEPSSAKVSTEAEEGAEPKRTHGREGSEA